MLTKEAWDASDLNFDHYIKSVTNELPVEINEELYLYFAEVVPPAVDVACSGYLMGEAVDTTPDYQFTYMAFVERGKKYYYIGDLTEAQFEEELKKVYTFYGRLSPSGGWIIDSFFGGDSLKRIISCLYKEDHHWEQHATSQDNWYFRFFVNYDKHMLAAYIEGDFVVTHHVNHDHFVMEYHVACSFYRHC